MCGERDTSLSSTAKYQQHIYAFIFVSNRCYHTLLSLTHIEN